MATIERHVTRDVIALDAMAPCREAAKLMAERKVGAVAVRQGDRIVGLVTERDLVLRVLAVNGDGGIPIGEAMRTDVPIIPMKTHGHDVSDLMRDHYTRHLLVEEGGKIAGIISMRDVIRLMLDDKQFLIEQLQTYIDGR